MIRQVCLFVFSKIQGASAQVLRRATYKGSVETERALPLDCATVPGMILILASFAKAHTLTDFATTVMAETLETVEEHMCLSQSIALVSSKLKYVLQVSHNRADLSSLKQVFVKKSLDWSRPGQEM